MKRVRLPSPAPVSIAALRQFLRRVYVVDGCRLIVVTSGPRSALARAADLVSAINAGHPAVVAESFSAGLRGVFLQLVAFSSVENAESLRSHLLRELDLLNEGIQINAGGGMHRVRMGPYHSRADAETVAERIRLAIGR